MALTMAERNHLIDQYAAGPERLQAALSAATPRARQWRPSAAEWTVHEIIVHCADSETNAAGRIRYLLAEPKPLIVGYDQDAWAVRLDYHAHPLEPALAAVTAVRANTVPLLRAIEETAWSRAGRHTEAGSYSAADWLRIYSVHVHDHADQIDAVVAAWLSAGSPAS